MNHRRLNTSPLGEGRSCGMDEGPGFGAVT